MKKCLFLCAILTLLCEGPKTWAQNFSVSTNIPSLLAGNINIEPSIGLNYNLSLQLSLQAKPFKFGLPLPTGLIHTLYGQARLAPTERLSWSKVARTENITFTPSLRYWGKGTYNQGAFFSLHGIVSLYKYGSDKYNPNYSKGIFYGAGCSAGYSWVLSSHWNLEAELGASLIYTKYDLLTPQDVVLSQGKTRMLALPTRVSLSLVYVI